MCVCGRVGGVNVSTTVQRELPVLRCCVAADISASTRHSCMRTRVTARRAWFAHRGQAAPARGRFKGQRPTRRVCRAQRLACLQHNTGELLADFDHERHARGRNRNCYLRHTHTHTHKDARACDSARGPEPWNMDKHKWRSGDQQSETWVYQK